MKTLMFVKPDGNTFLIQGDWENAPLAGDTLIYDNVSYKVERREHTISEKKNTEYGVDTVRTDFRIILVSA